MNQVEEPPHEHVTSRLSTGGWVGLALLAAICLAGAALRLVYLGEHPPGLYQDEAINGLDALDVLAGARPLYFEANNGREPLFVYLVALGVAIFGRTPLGVRAPAALLGVLTIPTTYWLGREWLGRRAGLLAAGLLSGLLWHVHLSRAGFRAVALPLVVGLGLALGARALRTGSRAAALGTGALGGLAFYTYLPARFTPVVAAVWLAYAWGWHRDWLRSRWRNLLWIASGCVATLIPLGVVAARRPELVLGRAGQVAVWNPAINQGDLPGMLLRHTGAALGMFVWRGDTIWRHNVPGRPVFDPLTGLAFAAGIGLALARWRRHPALALALLWTGVMLLPTVLAEDAPHFLRAVGVLPIVVLLPSAALDAGATWLEGKKWGALLTSAGLATLVAIGGGLSAGAYFGGYRADPMLGYYFQAAASELAHQVNTSQDTIILDRRFPESFPSVRFLVTRDDAYLYDEGETPETPPMPFTLFAWPHAGLDEVLAALPEGATIEVWPGPLDRGDLEPQAYRLYVAYHVRPASDLGPPIARYDNGITLLDVEAVPTNEAWSVRLTWRSEAKCDVCGRVFLHIVDSSNGALLAQYDGSPGSVYYPALSWRPGDVIIERFQIAMPAATPAVALARVGLYDPATGQRLPVGEAAVPVRDDALEISFDLP